MSPAVGRPTGVPRSLKFSPTSAHIGATGKRQIARLQQNRTKRAVETCASSRGPAVADVVVERPASLTIDSVAYKEGTFSVSGRLLTPAPPSQVYDVLTDYSQLPRVFHNVDECSVRWTDDGGKQLVQTCSWRFLIFRGSFVTELDVDEAPETRRLSFSLIQSAFMRKFVGCWDVEPGPDGGSLIRHSLSVQPAVAPPQQIGELTKNIFKSQVASILRDLEKELMRGDVVESSSLSQQE